MLPALATSQTTIDLGPLGILDLDPASLVLLGPIDMHQTCSKAVAVPVPNVRALAGRSVYTQAIVVDLVNAAETRLTNWTADVIE